VCRCRFKVRTHLDSTSERDIVTHWHWPSLLHACRGTLLTRRISLAKERVVGMASLMILVAKRP
jgi:hypothetical protein